MHCRWPLEAGEGVTPFFRSLLAHTRRDRNVRAARMCDECACALLHASSCFLTGQVRCWQRENERQRLPRLPDTPLPCGPASRPPTIQPRKQTAAQRESVKRTKGTNGAYRRYDGKKPTRSTAQRRGRRKEKKKKKNQGKTNTNQTFRRRCRNQVLRFTLPVVLSPFFRIFFLLFRARVYTRSKTHKSTLTRREEDGEPCFLSRAFARLQRRDDLPPASATTSGSRTLALGRLRFEH